LLQSTKEAPGAVEIGGPFAPTAFDMAAAEALRELLLADRDKAAAPPFHVITTSMTEPMVAPGQTRESGPNPGDAALKALRLPAAVLIMIVFLIVSLISLDRSPFNRSARAGSAPAGHSAGGRTEDVPTILYVLTDAPASKPAASGAQVQAAEPATAPDLRPSEPVPPPAPSVRPPAFQTRTPAQLVGLKPVMTVGNRQKP
jgi:hypothetical protein